MIATHARSRQRTLVAIGTHDLDTIEGPFTYEALPPEEIRFVPLKQTREFNAREVLEHYDAHDLKLRRGARGGCKAECELATVAMHGALGS